VDEAGDSTFPNWPEFRRLFAYDDLVGKVVAGRYEIVRRLGAGGMGVVFLARHIHLDKAFALKIISPRFMDEPEIGRRFLLEARAASKIDHPNVVSITDFGPPEEGAAFFAMEYLDGEDLAQLLARVGPLPGPRVVHIAAQIARALVAAHQRGVVHRDIKPQNCLRIRRDEAEGDVIKVLDFGLAKVLSGAGNSAWTVGGSPGYIAPEIYRGGKTDHRVDIFALGVLMYTLLVGRLPAQTPSDVALPPGAPILRRADLPPPLRAVIDRATADDPGLRYATAEAMLAALEEARVALERPAAAGRWPLLLASAVAALVLVARGGDLVAAVREPAAPRPVLADSPAAASDSLVSDPSVLSGSPTAPVPRDSSIVPGASGQPSTPGAPNGPPVPASGSTGTAGAPGQQSTPGAPDGPPVPAGSSTGTAGAPVPAGDRDIPASSDSPVTPVPADSPARPARRPPPGPFDEAAARALLRLHADDASACKAESSFRGVATRVRLTGTVTVTARGKATLGLPTGYDINPCLERLVAGLRFRASTGGGSFEYVFLL
jgi:serine/threonine-protein kinase